MDKCRALILPLGILLAVSAPAQTNYTENNVLRFAMNLNVHELDAQLGPGKLNEWLHHGPARLDDVLWSISRDCDLKEHSEDVPSEDGPLCVRFTFRRDSTSGWGLLRVGTRNLGISGPPRLEYFTVMTEQKIGPRPNKLSELPRVLNDVSSTKK